MLSCLSSTASGLDVSTPHISPLSLQRPKEKPTTEDHDRQPRYCSQQDQSQTLHSNSHDNVAVFRACRYPSHQLLPLQRRMHLQLLDLSTKILISKDAKRSNQPSPPCTSISRRTFTAEGVVALGWLFWLGHDPPVGVHLMMWHCLVAKPDVFSIRSEDEKLLITNGF